MKADLPFSVVVPAYNEEASLSALHAELVEVLTELGGAYEIIYVNDGSTDDTLKVARALPGATVIDLARRYGQATAFDAGFKHSRGGIVISLDGDGQNDPHDIPRLLQELQEKDLDVVAGWRVRRQDRKGIKFITVSARALRKLFIGDDIHDSGCALRVYRRAAIESLDLQGEMHRYILALLRWKGFRIGELPVNDRPRNGGVSKYGYGKAVRGFIDLVYVWFIYKYSQRPLHLFGYMGLASFALSFVSLCFTLYDKLALGQHVNRDSWFFLTFFFLLASIMLFSFGVILDLLMRIYHNSSPYEKRYYIRSTIEPS
jgi:glycosyltransferase involved in cell wall biosynthesis